jgi:hypothetical protein
MQPFHFARVLGAFLLILGSVVAIPQAARPAVAVPLYAGAGQAAVAGPITVSASLDTDTCAGGAVTLSASVMDANSVGIQGATASGYVRYKTTGHAFSFPATGTTGNTATVIDTGHPRGAYNVVFTVDAAAGGYTAETSATCYAP